MSSSRFLLLLSILLLKHTHGAVSNTVTSNPIHVANPNPYEIHEQRQQQPSVLTQSYQVLPESRNYYQYPQYLPTNTGYSNIQTAGQPYQMYSSSSDTSYGLSGSAPGTAPASVVPSESRTASSKYASEHQHSSSSEHHSRTPASSSGNERREDVIPAFIPVPGPSSSSSFSSSSASLSSSSNSDRHQSNYHKSRGPAAPVSVSNNHQAPPTFMIAPKPVLSYGAANPFLANLPPAQGPYGSPLTDAAHRGYDGSASSPPASASLDDTWEALEASLDADTRRRRHRFNV